MMIDAFAQPKRAALRAVFSFLLIFNASAFGQVTSRIAVSVR
jgi:hypothetical protein